MRYQTRLLAACLAMLLIYGRSSSAAEAPGDACAFLNQTQITAALGVTVAAGKQIGPSSALCGWVQPGDPKHSGNRVLLALYGSLGKLSPVERFENSKAPVQGIAKTPISGVGDDAYYIDTPGLGVGLNVRKANSAFQIRVYGFPVDQIKTLEKTLAQIVVAKL